MKEEFVVAVATLSGSAYYGLVEELKKRDIAFISLNPNSKIPIHINLVLTTSEEQAARIYSRLKERVRITCFWTAFFPKTDLVDKAKIPQFLKEMHAVIPGCQIVPTIHCRIDPETLWVTVKSKNFGLKPIRNQA